MSSLEDDGGRTAWEYTAEKRHFIIVAQDSRICVALVFHAVMSILYMQSSKRTLSGSVHKVWVPMTSKVQIDSVVNQDDQRNHSLSIRQIQERMSFALLLYICVRPPITRFLRFQSRALLLVEAKVDKPK